LYKKNLNIKIDEYGFIISYFHDMSLHNKLSYLK